MHIQADILSQAKIVGLSFFAGMYLISYLGMLITTLIVTKSDPTDPTVAYTRELRK